MYISSRRKKVAVFLPISDKCLTRDVLRVSENGPTYSSIVLDRGRNYHRTNKVATRKACRVADFSSDLPLRTCPISEQRSKREQKTRLGV